MRDRNRTGRHRENVTPRERKLGRTFVPLEEPPREEKPGRSADQRERRKAHD